MYRIAICDNDKKEAKRLGLFLKAYYEEKGEELQILFYDDGLEIIDSYSRNLVKLDLIFMEIIMENIDGIKTSQTVRKYDTCVKIAFVTKTKDYAIDGYKVDASGYFLKPFKENDICEYLDELCMDKQAPRLALKGGGKYHYISCNDILFFESSNHAIICNFSNGKVIKYSETLQDIEQKLCNKKQFLRCHKSFIVNMDYIDRVEEVFILINGTRVPFRIRQKKQISECYYKYFKGENIL